MVCRHCRLWLTVNAVRAMTRKMIHCLSRESSALKLNFRKATSKYPSCKVSGNRGVSLLQVASEVGKHPFQPTLPPQLNCNPLRLGSGAWLKGANRSKVLGSPLEVLHAAGTTHSSMPGFIRAHGGNAGGAEGSSGKAGAKIYVMTESRRSECFAYGMH